MCLCVAKKYPTCFLFVTMAFNLTEKRLLSILAFFYIKNGKKLLKLCDKQI
jgi:hypothetical protein